MALAVCVLGGVITRPAQAQLEVDQFELFLNPRSPDTRVGFFSVLNRTDEAVQATISIADWDRSEDGANRFLPLGTLPQSCRAMLKVFPLSVRIEGRATQMIRVAIDGADTLRTACWSIVFVETQQARREGDELGLSYIVRTGVKIYVEPTGLARDGGIEDIVVRPRKRPPKPAAADSAKQELVVAFRNSGGIHLVTRGSIEFRRPDNSVTAKVPIPEFPTLPGALRLVSLPLPKLPPGKHVALVLLDYAGPEVAAGQIEFEVR